MDGLLLLDKPTGPTSHDIVASLRAVCGGVKTGHAGTLDPLASGLLVILLGKATKLAPYIPGDPKVYEGCILLGISTDSLDIEGELLAEASYEGSGEEAAAALAAQVGTVEQQPPMFSAAKYKGKPLYRYARRGVEVPRQSRQVQVYRFEMTGFRSGKGRAEVDFQVECSPGTYVRELAARVGDTLGCGGVISSLRRIASGPFRVENALTLHDVERRMEGHAGTEGFVLSMERAVEGYKRIDVSDEGLRTARNGAPLNPEMICGMDTGIIAGDTVAVFAGGALLGMHRVTRESPLASYALRMM
jgi:tRNA pseudouridine55 synthase